MWEKSLYSCMGRWNAGELHHLCCWRWLKRRLVWHQVSKKKKMLPAWEFRSRVIRKALPFDCLPSCSSHQFLSLQRFSGSKLHQHVLPYDSDLFLHLWFKWKVDWIKLRMVQLLDNENCKYEMKGMKWRVSHESHGFICAPFLLSSFFCVLNMSLTPSF